MKLLGIMLILVGILCFACLVTGLVAWTAPVTQDATPGSVAGMIGLRMLACTGLGLLSVLAGIVALCRGGASAHKKKLMVVVGLAACLMTCSCSTAEQTRLKNNMTYKASFYDLIMQLNVDLVAHKKALQVLQVPFEQGKNTFYNNLVIDGEALTTYMASGKSTHIVENEGRFAFAALMKNGKLIDLVTPENVVGIMPLQDPLEKWDERKVILLCQPPGGFYYDVEYRITPTGFIIIDPAENKDTPTHLSQKPKDKTTVAVAVDALVAALSQSSLEKYRSCLHPKTAEVPEYGNEEAMRFWKKQFDDLKAGGFTGNWRFKEVQASEASPRLPAGSMKAYPMVGDREISEYLLLILVDGEWRVLRLFS